MTKQEVQNNIRYNENLVNQYQREINNLNNQINSLNSGIQSSNGQIAGLVARKKTLEREMSELNGLRAKLQGLKDNFGNRQSRRMNNFVRYSAQVINVHFIGSYLSGMRDLLSGREYQNALNGIVESIAKVMNKLRAKQQEIDSVQAEINKAQQNINNANDEINRCRQRLNQRRSDLAYRKNRIQYWKEQLKKAT